MSLMEDIEQITKQIRQLENQLEKKKTLLKQEMYLRGEYHETITPKMKQSLVTINKWLGMEIPKICYYDKQYCHKFIGEHIREAVNASRKYYKEKNNI